MGLRRPTKNKNPPILSHEFIIQNHADIVSCVAMVFVIGLMFQATNPLASVFIAMQHNVTINQSEPEMPETAVSFYTYGLKDICATIFYTMIVVIIHAVIQEYILDKLNRKMHLSKIKHSKFNESGQLLVFYLVSAAWGLDIVIRENYASAISRLWEGYPHSMLPFHIKFYFIIQVSYWIHCYPELYFQKTRKEEIGARIQYATLYLVFITLAYLLNFTRVALCLLILHYTVEFVFHVARLLYFADKTELANTGFMTWNVLFVVTRLSTIILSVLTFWYGLEQTGAKSIHFPSGNFNTSLVRINCLAAVCLLQAWMMWNFINFHLRRMRERNAAATPVKAKSFIQKKSSKDKRSKVKNDDSSDRDEAEIVNTTENGTVRQRGTPKSRRV